LEYFRQDPHFSSYQFFNIIISILVYLFFPFQIKITYGPTDSFFQQIQHPISRFKHFFNLTINNQIGVFLMHFPGLYFFIVSLKYYNSERFKSCPTIIFLVIYIYRCFIYPFFRHFYSTPFSIRSILIIGLLSANHGFLIARSISFTQETNIFKDYFYESQAYESFRQYGYYTEKFKDTNLRIVSLNCLICNSMNFHLISDSAQVAKMFKWLENVLSDAEKNNEKVYLLDHIPLRCSQHTYDCSIRLKILIERYQHIISGLISAHTHRDEINLIREYSNPNKYSIINYIGPSLSTYNKFWPGYRIYYADSETKFINDFVQMRLDLDETNKRDEPVWFISYQSSKFYNVTRMDDYENIANANIDENFAKKFLTDNIEIEHEYTNPKVIDEVRCYFQYDNYKDMAKCKNAEKNFESALQSSENLRSFSGIGDQISEKPFVKSDLCP